MAAIRAALDHAASALVDRGAMVELVGLAAVAGEHLLVLGPPGTAKSEAVRRVARALGGRSFEYLLGRFTEPSEIFGPVDLRRLREGVVETATAGMLPEAELAFLDEVFLGSTAILNTLLGILNERRFRRGHTSIDCPLRVCVGASNALPEDESLLAFSDRFLLRYFAAPIPDPMLEELLEVGWRGDGAIEEGPRATIDDLDRVRAASREVRVDRVRPRLADALRKLRGAGIVLSDRRTVKVQRLVAAAAALAGRDVATRADLWPLVFAIPEAAEQDEAREVLRPLLADTESGTLPRAAEHASAGPRARAENLRRAARELLDAGPPDGDVGGWRLRLEGVLREIDATTPEAERPPELVSVRTELVREVERGWSETAAPS